MDLYAYSQIGDLSKLASENGIVVPRLRGYRLMRDEELVSSDQIKEIMREAEVHVCEELCLADPPWSENAGIRCYSSESKKRLEFYLIKNNNQTDDDYRDYIGIRWDRIHGKKRRVLKHAIKMQSRSIQKQYEMWNKYAGKDNILYIHARIGGYNWDYFGGNELIDKPWFLGKVDDHFDCTYCDIYAKLNI